MDSDQDVKALLRSMDIQELRHAVYHTWGIRPALGVPREDLVKAVLLEYPLELVDGGKVNAMRTKLRKFIKKYKNQLSLSCDGDCRKHSDGVVVNCYMQFLRDTRPILDGFLEENPNE